MGKFKKFIQLSLFIISFGQAGLAAAHAVVTDSSLEITPVKPNQPAEVALKFNSNIELALSQIFLVSKGDKQTRLDAIPGAKPGQVIISVPALSSGEYALRFKVFAADGHLTEDIIHFLVTQ